MLKKIINPNWNVDQPSSYIDVVIEANLSSSKFNCFRREKQYCGIVENLTQDDGLSIFKRLSPPIINLLQSTHLADQVGSPTTYDYNGLIASPTTLRYALILQKISELFHDLKKIKSIAEIGVGYGGQARLICQSINQVQGQLEFYSLIDLPDVLELSKRYLENFSFRNGFKYLSKSELTTTNSDFLYDLVISNYAFSEFSRSMQNEYIEKVLLKSRSGFILMNNGKTDVSGAHICGKFGNKECILDKELLNILPGSRVLEVEGLTTEGVYLIVYGV